MTSSSGAIVMLPVPSNAKPARMATTAAPSQMALMRENESVGRWTDPGRDFCALRVGSLLAVFIGGKYWRGPPRANRG